MALKVLRSIMRIILHISYALFAISFRALFSRFFGHVQVIVIIIIHKEKALASTAAC